MVQNTHQKGQWAEDVAARFLLKNNFKILFRNWRAERGDIDIIALEKDYLVFVEVKGGYSPDFGPPELRITSAKKRQLYKLASVFLQRSEEYNIDYTSCRFDVIIVDGFPDRHNIRHYPNAFTI
ncbi:MAG: YraN family protein [Calditrichia bacterium]